MKTFSDIKHVLYINLDHRTDRRTQIEQELTNIGLIDKAIRIKAIQPTSGDGAIGCTLSHISCIKYAIQNNFDHVLILEDDICFGNKNAITTFQTSFNSFLQTNLKWDVILFAGNNVGNCIPIDKCAVKVERCQTTTGYLVKKEYFETLLNNFIMGIQLLIKTPNLRPMYAIDIFWFKLQAAHEWYLIIPQTVHQRAGYSDIEKRVVNYEKVMTKIK